MDATQVLQEYAASRSDDAFRSLVDQYLGLVYSACLRQLKDRHHAEDATQAVFILLSQKAGALHQNYLTGWLLTTSRYVCANIRKRETRLKRRQQEAAMNPTHQIQSPRLDLVDLLDEALCHLSSTDREALVLRYLKEQPIEDVAQQLGLSPEAARKRIFRGLEKLRAYFSRRGVAATSAALGTLLTEQLPGAALTSALRQSLTQGILQVCHAGAHSAAASVAVAKGAKTMMMLAKLKTAAAVAVIVAALGTTGWMISRASADNAPLPQAAAPVTAPPTAPPQSAPPAPTLPSTAPTALTDVAQILRWSVLLDDAGYDTLKQTVPQAVESPTKNLIPGTCETEALHGAILQAMQTNGAVCVSDLRSYSHNTWATAATAPVYLDLSAKSPEGTLSIRGGGSGKLNSTLIDPDHRNIQLDFPNLKLDLRDSPDQTASASLTLTYTGVLTTGNSLVFVANIPTSPGPSYHLLIAYEAVKLPDWQMPYFALVSDLQWYLNSTPETVSAMARRALVWAASARHDPYTVPPKFRKQLPDGTIAEVTAVNFLNEYPFCWWDGEGQPIDADQDVFYTQRNLDRPAYSEIAVLGPGGDFNNAFPLGRSKGAYYPNFMMHGDYLSMGHSGHASFWAPFGPWTQIGQITPGGSIVESGITYNLIDVTGAPPEQIVANLQPNTTGGDAIVLTAVLNDGREIGSLYPNEILGKRDYNPPSEFTGIDPKDIKFFHVWKRQRQLVTFSGLPTVPAVTPEDNPTPGEVAAALAKLNMPQENPSTQPTR